MCEHWRPDAGWQTETQFSDGTLRLLGLLWSVLDGTGPLLLEELHAVHRPVLIGLGVLFVTGALLMAADFKTFVESPVFWVKMGLLLALLVNGALLYQAEQRLNRATVANIDPPQQLYVRLRRSSHLSIGLWLAITVGGAILTSTGS